MAVYLTDPLLEDHLKRERAESGADRYDEVWEGVTMMSPLADDEHQELVTSLCGPFLAAVQWPGLGTVRAGVNVSDRDEGWTHNYRIPDVAVFLRETAAQNLGTHWLGGPDFAVEVASPDDRTRDKFDFYAAVGTRELLLIDRDPWSLELYRLADATLTPVGTATLDAPADLTSAVLPLSFRLLPGPERPRVEVVHRDGEQRWTV